MVEKIKNSSDLCTVCSTLRRTLSVSNYQKQNLSGVLNVFGFVKLLSWMDQEENHQQRKLKDNILELCIGLLDILEDLSFLHLWVFWENCHQIGDQVGLETN